MADAANLSLDAIIKNNKKNKPLKKQNAKGKVVKTTNGKKATVKRLGNNRPLKTTGNANKKVSDARNKIILAKRQKMGDARERLGELARQGDARERLNKLKGKPGVAATRIGNRMASRIGAQGAANKLAQNKAAQIKKQLGLQTGKNFNKQNVTGQGKNLTRTVAGVAGKSAKGGATGFKTQRNKIIPAVNRQKGFNQTVVTIKNNRANMNQQSMRPMKQKQMQTQNVRSAPYRAMRPQGMRSDMVWETYPQEQVIYQERVYPQEQFYQPRPVMMAAPQRIQMAPRPYRETVYVDEYDQPIRQRPVQYVEAAPRPRPAAPRVQQRVQQRVQKKPQQMSSNLAARLDQQQQQQPRANKQGHKVLVTNLHPCVSGEDMEELFSTIGTIVTARMVREGVAEAQFLKEEDALRSVEVFHNRQLDGLPMNVTIVGKKGFNNQKNNQRNQQRGGPQPKSVLKAARGRTGYYV